MSQPAVLVYSMGEVIGDGLIKLPFVAAVREAFPGHRLVWCAAKGSTVYQGALAPITAGLIDEVIAGGVTGADAADLFLLRRPFGGRRFEVAIDTQTNVRRTLVARRARAPGGVFVSPSADFRLSDRKPEQWPEALVERLATLLMLASGRAPVFRPTPLTNPRAEAAARALLPGGPYVGFAPGAGGKSKRWPLDRYIELARRQQARGRAPVFFLGPDDEEEAQAVARELPAALVPERGRTDEFGDVAGPLLVIALAGRLTAAVANDAGPGHMLAAGGAPLLSLQGVRRKAAKFHPSARRLEMLVADDYGADAGMAAIPLEDADAALERLIGGEAG